MCKCHIPRAYWTAVHSSTVVTPYHMLLGRDKPLHWWQAVKTNMSNVHKTYTDTEITFGASPAVKPHWTADQSTIDDDPTEVFDPKASSTPAADSQDYVRAIAETMHSIQAMCQHWAQQALRREVGGIIKKPERRNGSHGRTVPEGSARTTFTTCTRNSGAACWNRTPQVNRAASTRAQSFPTKSPLVAPASTRVWDPPQWPCGPTWPTQDYR